MRQILMERFIAKGKIARVRKYYTLQNYYSSFLDRIQHQAYGLESREWAYPNE